MLFSLAEVKPTTTGYNLTVFDLFGGKGGLVFWSKKHAESEVGNVEQGPPSVTVIRDEAKIIEQFEKTKRLKLYLLYGIEVALIAAAVKLIG